MSIEGNCQNHQGVSEDEISEGENKKTKKESLIIKNEKEVKALLEEILIVGKQYTRDSVIKALQVAKNEDPNWSAFLATDEAKKMIYDLISKSGFIFGKTSYHMLWTGNF